MNRRQFLQVSGSVSVSSILAENQLGVSKTNQNNIPELLNLKIENLDYLYQVVAFQWPENLVPGSDIKATVTVTQPHGYKQEFTVRAIKQGARGQMRLFYPLIDEGTYYREAQKEYRFSVQLLKAAKVIRRGEVSLNPDIYFGEIGGQRLNRVDSSRQFIECCPERPAFIDHRDIGFTIRALPDRIATCDVQVDVVKPEGYTSLAEPVKLTLNGKKQRHSFDGAAWERGEYWLRVQVLEDGKPAGPFLIRQFWIEESAELTKPELPLRPGDNPQYLVDDWLFLSSTGLRHAPDQLEPLTDFPLFRFDRPWEVESPLPRLAIQSFTKDPDSQQYRITYHAGRMNPNSKLLQNVTPGMLSGAYPKYLCLAVSDDGIHWEKPHLGLVAFKGSRRNNILRDLEKEAFTIDGQSDSYPYRTKERPAPKRYRFRYYDAKSDGPVDMDRFAFRIWRDRLMEPQEQFLGTFRPRHGDFWGLERRGDTFLVLSHDPVLGSGHGMSLRTTLERASTYPFEGDPSALFQCDGRSTCTFYDRHSKIFYYYFRPDYPPYPPNGAPYYMWHGKDHGIRTRAVMWTRDGRHWNRRHMLVPDEHDPAGLTLYGFGFLKPVGQQDFDTSGQLFYGAILHWNLHEQVTRQELVWSRDRVHWHRFGANRKPLLQTGPPKSWNVAIRGLSTCTSIINSKGEEEWWFPYQANNHRYVLGHLHGANNLEEFKKKCPYMDLAPFFTSWEEIYKEAANAVTLPGLARCKAGRLTHVEPTERRGEFTTHPLVLEGVDIVINAQTQCGGSIGVEVQDAEGNVLPGFELAACHNFSDDRVAHRIRWERASIQELYGRVVKLRFVLAGARLYSFRIISK